MMEQPERKAICVKCKRYLSYFGDPLDDEARNWQDDRDGSSYCPEGGGDHFPLRTDTAPD